MRKSNPSLETFLNTTQRLAIGEGLHLFGAADLGVDESYLRYRTWLDEGRHGSMEWMTKHLEIRKNPENLLPGAKTALVFGFNYYLGDKWVLGNQNDAPKISQYARLRDYHKFLRTKLERVQTELLKIFGTDHVWRITVDSAPILERAIAANTGTAFIGKNTCLIHPKLGSFFLLGEILTSWDFNLRSSQPTLPEHRERSETGGCGTCRRCQVHCPTGALDQDYRIDARKCISYWTIEHRGEIPVEYWPWVGRYIFGCDICQLVCPYNRSSVVSPETMSLVKIPNNISLSEMAMMDQSFYEKIFSGTPMTRAKRSGLRRNAIIAGTVRGDVKVILLLDQLGNDGDTVIQSTANQAKEFLKSKKFD